MQKSGVYSLAVKILGLYFFARFVHYLIDFFYMFSANKDFNYAIQNWEIYKGIALTTVVYFAIGYLATFKSNLITDRIFRTKDEAVQIALGKSDYLELSIATIALIAILYSLPQLLSEMVYLIYFKEPEIDNFFVPHHETDFFRPTFQLVIGIFLLLNSRNFAKKIVNRGEIDDKYEKQSE
ncbi:hypothetical protein [Marinoscillum sp. MHG1-6]|uniref:hypothetical protein n=1 Tax=Marinoscillum sp. MHG1-6 TaxID=2959627 RepID=UPI0021587C33|nr:hypothetical protein [Marinoscillum sp. MHG1-6]